MCYSPGASIVAFLVNAATSVFLMRFDVALGLFFFYVGLMQLYDLVFWTHQGVAGTDASVNFWVTKLAMVTNNLQPVVLAFLIVFFKTNALTASGFGSHVALALLGLYVLFAVPYSVRAWRTVKYTRVTPESYPSLHWKWNSLSGNMVPYALHLVSMTALLLFGFEWPLNVLLAAVCVISFVLSYHYYKGKTAIGRFWCYFACYVPILVALFLIAMKSRTGASNGKSTSEIQNGTDA